jgi:hypothetical protein
VGCDLGDVAFAGRHRLEQIELFGSASSFFLRTIDPRVRQDLGCPRTGRASLDYALFRQGGHSAQPGHGASAWPPDCIPACHPDRIGYANRILDAFSYQGSSDGVLTRVGYAPTSQKKSPQPERRRGSSKTRRVGTFAGGASSHRHPVPQGRQPLTIGCGVSTQAVPHNQCRARGDAVATAIRD